MEQKRKNKAKIKTNWVAQKKRCGRKKWNYGDRIFERGTF